MIHLQIEYTRGLLSEFELNQIASVYKGSLLYKFKIAPPELKIKISESILTQWSTWEDNFIHINFKLIESLYTENNIEDLKKMAIEAVQVILATGALKTEVPSISSEVGILKNYTEVIKKS